MHKKITLSVIVPVYNTEKYLSKCLNSIDEAISLCDFEVEAIIINDGSTDTSKDIAQKFVDVHSYASLVNKSNGGLASVKNVGLSLAKGTYISFVDSDDTIASDMFCKMVSKMQESKADISVCDITVTYEDEKKNYIQKCVDTYSDTELKRVLNTPLMASSCNKIVLAKLYEGLSFPEKMNNEDVAVTPVVLGKAKKIVVLDEGFYNYYQREGSIQNSGFNQKRFVIFQTVKKAINSINELGLDNGNIIVNAIIFHQIFALAFWPLREEKWKSRKQLADIFCQLIREELYEIDFLQAIDQCNSPSDKRIISQEKFIAKTLKRAGIYCLRCEVLNKLSQIYRVAKCIKNKI